ncbi:DUF4377 domain-containing protein [Tenacibaculum agarivorans]|uniref:DUF4377 domain-containing protein n=1 Tax=Tenacibaculum agarivorans TaxID=1908389 RepID=UPI00094B909F|nr:DUF4377 domain-containing protein [Tenacibaculum agarivorans]
MKHFTLYLLVLFSLLSLSSCSSDDHTPTKEVILKVNHYEVIGFGPFLGLYNLIQEEDKFTTNEWDIFYNNISGFNYEFGYIYEVKVLVTKIDNPPADSPAYKYELKNIISKQKVEQNTEFEITLKKAYSDTSDIYLTGTIDQGFKIIDQLDIECKEKCEQLKEIQNIKDIENVIGIFTHGNNPNTIELVRLEKN